MKKQKDIRVIRTQTFLLESLEELIKDKKLSLITITELCSKAKINRNTFYYHYNNIYELLNEHKKTVIEAINDISAVSETRNKQNLIDIFDVFKYHPHFLNIIISPNCDQDFVYDIFKAVSAKTTITYFNDNKTELTNKERLLCNYINAGFDAVLKAWIIEGMNESSEELADILWNSSNSVYSSLYAAKNRITV